MSGRTPDHRISKDLAFRAILERMAQRESPPAYFPPEFVSKVRFEMTQATRRAREELKPEQVKESVQVERRKPELPAREPAPLTKKKHRRAKPAGMTLTRSAELWLKAIGSCHFVSANVPSARSIMYAAAKNTGLTIKTEHRGNGLVVGTVIDP